MFGRETCGSVRGSLVIIDVLNVIGKLTLVGEFSTALNKTAYLLQFLNYQCIILLKSRERYTTQIDVIQNSTYLILGPRYDTNEKVIPHLELWICSDTTPRYCIFITYNVFLIRYKYPDNKIHGASMGPTWVLSAPDGPHVGPMNLAIRVYNIYM